MVESQKKTPYRVFDKGLRFYEPKSISYVIDSYLLENRSARPFAGNNTSTPRKSEWIDGMWMVSCLGMRSLSKSSILKNKRDHSEVPVCMSRNKALRGVVCGG